jgi:hypothetical protein
MKNKLKLTTALVGSLVAISAGSALAQNLTTYYDGGKDGTTVSGNMNISYRDQKVKGPTATFNEASGLHGFGKEVQININSRGKLNNGWGYAAGFSIEADGSESSIRNGLSTVATTTSQGLAGSSGIFGENNFIDIIIGNTTITLSADHIQNPDANPTMMGAPSTYLAPYAFNNLNGGGAMYSATYTAQSKGIYPTSLNSPYENLGVGVVQNVSGIGSFSALYVPQRSSDGGSNNSYWGNDNGNNSSWGDYSGGYGSAYELGFVGGLGVPGLTTSLWYNHSDTDQKGALVPVVYGKMNGEKVNASYVIGSTGLSVAGEYAKNNFASTVGTSAAGSVTGKSIGVSYAITKDFTVAGTYGLASQGNAGNGLAGNLANTSDEKIKIVSAGYSLGPVAIKGQYRKTSNLGGFSTGGSESDFLVWSGVNF